MKAFILAAGEGTRLRPLTSNIPKPLLMLAGRPYLSHLITSLRSAGIEDIYILVGWKSNRIKEFFGNGSSLGVRITYLEQKKRLGTANAIGMAKGIIDDDFLCINGDVVMTPEGIEDMASKFDETGGMLMGVVEVENPSRFGVIHHKDGELERIEEKPERPMSNLINAGIFGLTPKVFDYIDRTGLSSRGEYEFTDTLTMIADESSVKIHRLTGSWIDVGHAWDLLKANELLMCSIRRDIRGTIEEGAVIKGEVVVEEGATVRSGSYIEGPVYISQDCDIGPNCYIRPSTCLGRGVKVGNAVEVKNSIVMDGTHIPHHNYVGDSIIGERCNLGAGTKIANLRFDDRTVRVSMKGEMVNTGLRKMGVIMGDDVKTGINSMIEPGTIIGERSIIGMGARAKGNLGPNSKVF